MHMMGHPVRQQFAQARHQLSICLQFLNSSEGDGICISHGIDLGVEVEGGT